MKRLLLLSVLILTGCASDPAPKQTKLAVDRPPEAWYFVPNEPVTTASNTPTPAEDEQNYQLRRQANATQDIQDQLFRDSLNP